MDHAPHTLQDYDLELQSLRGDVLAMGRVALEMVEAIGKTLKDDGHALPELARRGERELDASEVEVDRHVQTILLRFQPVASDLREVTGALRISRDLEQVGDDARSILQRIEKLRPWLAGDAEEGVQRLWKSCESSLRGAIESFARRDQKLAVSVHRLKVEVRKDVEEILRHVASRVAANRDLASSYMEAIHAVTALERMRNASFNIAAAVIFVETAEDVRHRRTMRRIDPGHTAE